MACRLATTLVNISHWNCCIASMSGKCHLAAYALAPLARHPWADGMATRKGLDKTMELTRPGPGRRRGGVPHGAGSHRPAVRLGDLFRGRLRPDPGRPALAVAADRLRRLARRCRTAALRPDPDAAGAHPARRRDHPAHRSGRHPSATRRRPVRRLGRQRRHDRGCAMAAPWTSPCRTSTKPMSRITWTWSCPNTSATSWQQCLFGRARAFYAGFGCVEEGLDERGEMVAALRT